MAHEKSIPKAKLQTRKASSKPKAIVLLRTTDHIPYVYRWLLELNKTHKITFLLERDWDRTIQKRTLESPLLSPIDFDAEYLPKIKRKHRLLLEFKEAISWLMYRNQFGDKNFYTRRWKGYLKKQTLSLCRALRLTKLSITEARIDKIQKMLEFLFFDKRVADKLRALRCDIVVATSLNLRFSQQNFVVAAANRMNIPTFYPVLTWDNLSTKSFLTIQPRKIFCWDEGQRDWLTKNHFFPNENIEICGPIYFEKWFDAISQRKSARNLARKNVKVLYLGSSLNIIGPEEVLLMQLCACAREAERITGSRFEVIFKSHPAKQISLPEYFRAYEHDKFGLPQTNEEEEDHLHLFEKSHLVFGVNTTAMIEASLVNRHVFALIQGKKARQMSVHHFEKMLQQFSIKPATFKKAEKISEPNISNVLQLMCDTALGNSAFKATTSPFASDPPSKLICSGLSKHEQ